MDQELEHYWRGIDDKIWDIIYLLRLKWPDFNQYPSIEKIIVALNDAYKASGKAADLMERGHIK